MLTLFSTAACLSEDKVPVSIVRLEGSREYQAYMADTIETDGVRMYVLLPCSNSPKKCPPSSCLGTNGSPCPSPQSGVDHIKDTVGKLVPARPEIYDTDFVHGVLIEVLHNITAAAESRIGSAVKIGAITMPEQFDWTGLEPVRKAAKALDPKIHPEYGVSKFWCMVAGSHSTEHCTARRPRQCAHNETRHWVLLITLQQRRVDFAIGEACSTAEFLYARKFITLPQVRPFPIHSASSRLYPLIACS